MRQQIAALLCPIFLAGCRQHAVAPEKAAEVEILAADLIRAYHDGSAEAQARFGGKRVRVRGTLRNISVGANGRPALFLEGKGGDGSAVQCVLPANSEGRLAAFEIGGPVSVSGVVEGVLPDVVLEPCE